MEMDKVHLLLFSDSGLCRLGMQSSVMPQPSVTMWAMTDRCRSLSYRTHTEPVHFLSIAKQISTSWPWYLSSLRQNCVLFAGGHFSKDPGSMSHRGVGQMAVFRLSSKASFNLAEAPQSEDRMKLFTESYRLARTLGPPPSNETLIASFVLTWIEWSLPHQYLCQLSELCGLCGQGWQRQWGAGGKCGKSELILRCPGNCWAPFNRGLSCDFMSWCLWSALCPPSFMNSVNFHHIVKFYWIIFKCICAFEFVCKKCTGYQFDEFFTGIVW